MVDQIQKITQENERTVVYFYQPGCTYCDYLEPHFHKLQEAYGDVATFTSVDISDNGDLVKDKYDFQTVPMVIYFLHGKPVARHGSRDMTITFEDMETTLRDVFGLEEQA